MVDPKEMRNDIALQVPEIYQPEVHALRALSVGEADREQQVMAYRLIMNKLSMVDNTTFVPAGGDRSAFLAGRAFVGQRIRGLMNKDIGSFPEKPKTKGDDK